MPFDATHPDPEQLAAWQAGELAGPDGVQVEAHVAGCAECTRLVAMAERGRAALTALPEVEPPASLHLRLAAAVERGLAVADGVHQSLATGNGAEERRLTAVTDGQGEPTRDGEPARAGGRARAGDHAAGARPVPLAERRRRAARPRDRRLVALLSVAAAVILLVAGLVPLLRHIGGPTSVTAERGRTTTSPSQALAAPPAESLPVFSAPGGFSGSALRSALTSDPAARAAYQAALGERPAPAGSPGPKAVNPQFGSGATDKSTGRSESAGGTAAPAAGNTAAGAAGLQKDLCVAAARNQAGNQGLRPAFFVDTVYRGRPATVLVTVRPGAPAQADLWAFPRGNCSVAPFANEPVGVTPP